MKEDIGMQTYGATCAADSLANTAGLLDLSLTEREAAKLLLTTHYGTASASSDMPCQNGHSPPDIASGRLPPCPSSSCPGHSILRSARRSLQNRREIGEKKIEFILGLLLPSLLVSCLLILSLELS